MEAQEHPIRHFALMGELAAALKSLPAQVLEHSYSYEAFGSWWLAVRCRGVPLRLVWDGKEGQVTVQRSASKGPPYDWKDAVAQSAIARGVDVSVTQLVEAVRAHARSV